MPKKSKKIPKVKIKTVLDPKSAIVTRTHKLCNNFPSSVDEEEKESMGAFYKGEKEILGYPWLWQVNLTRRNGIAWENQFFSKFSTL